MASNTSRIYGAGFSFLVVAVIVFVSMQSFKEHLGRMNHVYAFADSMKELSLRLASMQRSVRGYILTGEKGSRDRYMEAEKEFQDTIKTLLAMPDDARAVRRSQKN